MARDLGFVCLVFYSTAVEMLTMVYCIYTTDLSASAGKGAGVKFRNRKLCECSAPPPPPIFI